ncbi:lipoprotein [Herbaspirillum sp. BH-1]|uniref:Xanthine dehydrogenase accessory factor n=1 Tax=Herbaspirillum frisingense TaxID=92645 RepID=A0ABU1PA76_9BURK|nr:MULTISPECIES: XdhC family protein [Herbaspirillum]MDR6582832.1 xanthine dehydrogenase accessory factor [Herbaspirillum frisingense]PLY60585.1 lipoprotein [Herbaspirillum sp. BH-1]
MDSIDLQVLQACVQWLQQGHACEYVTVVRTWGSSPRPPGSTMAIRADGVVVGSVSGGCIEDDLIAHARVDGMTRRTPQRLSYGISADEAHRFGLPCGGTVELLVEPLGPHSQMAALLARLQRRVLTRRRLDLASGTVLLEDAGEDAPLQLDTHSLTTLHGPRLRLLIIGAGQLSQFLAQIATALDYQVTVCDPREEHRLAWSLPGVSVVHAMPDDLVLEMRLDHRSAVVALTHDPRLDDMALMEALKTDAFYIGAIGSRLNQSRRRERLLQLDLDADQIAKLHGPVGLDIGSRTPHEIAISIMAQMIQVRGGTREAAMPAY